MPTQIQNNIIGNIGLTPVSVLSTGTKVNATVIGLSLTNISSTLINASVILEDSTNTSVFYLKNTVIASGTSLRLISTGEKLILTENSSVYVQSSTENSIDVIVSYVTI